MAIITKLTNNSRTLNSLAIYITENFHEIADYFLGQNFNTLLDNRGRIKDYIDNNIVTIRQLDLTNDFLKSFVILLLEVTEDLGLLMEFQVLFNFISTDKTKILSNRLVASSRYMMGVERSSDYLDRVDEIVDLLHQSYYGNEGTSYYGDEDSKKKIVLTFANFIAEVVINFGQFNPEFVEQFKGKVKRILDDERYAFLFDDVIRQIIDKQTGYYLSYYESIKAVLRSYIVKDNSKISFSPNKAISEEEGRYYDAINDLDNIRFSQIMEIANEHYRTMTDQNNVFFSLKNGVKILSDVDQLFVYMRSYGNMHYQKLVSAFESKQLESFGFFKNNTINVVDWGCGQAMGTISFLDYLKSKNVNQTASTITLIEPSEIALKRASLHVKAFTNDSQIFTINKDIDSLTHNELFNKDSETKLHIFSNILDIENTYDTYSISLTKLLQLISETYTGENYFVCVSPYITDLKTSRINSFVNFFKSNDTFALIDSADNKKYENIWKNNWTRVLRIFRVLL